MSSSARRELPASAEAFLALLHATQEAALLHDDAEVLAENPAACALFGVDPAIGLAGQPFDALLTTTAAGTRALRPDGTDLDVTLETHALPGGLRVSWLRDPRGAAVLHAELRRLGDRLEETERLAELGGWEHDVVSGTVAWSPELFRILELDRALERPSFDRMLTITFPEDRERVQAAWARALEQGEPFELSHRIVSRSGRLRHVYVRASPQFDAGRRVRRLIGTTQDITDRQRLRIFEQVASFSTAGVSFADEQGRITYASDAFLRIFGYERADELIGKPASTLWASEERARSMIEQIVTRGSVVAEAVARTKQGTERIVQIASSRVVDELGATIGLFGLFFDVTDRHEAERQLAHQRALLRQLVDASPDWIFALDPEGRYLLANRALAEGAGKRPEEMLGRPAKEFWPAAMLHGDPARGVRGTAEEDAAALAGALVHNPHREVTTAKAETRVLDVIKGPLREASDGPIVGHFAIARDVTEVRAAEKQLHESQEQLRRAQKLDAIGRLAGGVAHDFNNMLTVVLSVAGALREEVEGKAEGIELVDELLSAGSRAAVLTRQLLSVARLNPSVPSVIALPTAVQEFSRFLGRVVGERVKLDLELAADTWPVRLDGSHLEQVLLNFAVNARDAMPDGGRLLFRTRNQPALGERPARVVLEAVDSGVGMDEAVRARIFEPFFTTKEPGKGTGLGLATVYGIVRQAGGDLTVDSAPGRGATFRVVLPPAEDEADESRAEESARGPRGAGTILLVEDDAAVRGITRRVLVHAGYHVVEAGSGVAALQRVEEGVKPALLLVDVVMHGLSGEQLARKLRAALPALPIVFVSGHATNAEEFADLGPLVRKPYAGDVLLRAVAAALGKPVTR